MMNVTNVVEFDLFRMSVVSESVRKTKAEMIEVLKTGDIQAYAEICNRLIVLETELSKEVESYLAKRFKEAA